MVSEYKVGYGNLIPVDTVLISKKYYDTLDILRKKEDYARDSIWVVSYFNGVLAIDSNTRQYRKNVNRIFVTRNGNRQSEYYNARISEETDYDIYGNELLIRSYNTNPASTDTTPLIFQHLYAYDSAGNIIVDTLLTRVKNQTDTQYEAVLIYDTRGRLKEENFVKTFCCDLHQPYPDDKIIYFYDSAGKLSREIYIQDLKIKRKYRNIRKEYSTVSVIGYKYNQAGKLVSKKIFVPNDSKDPAFPVEKLFKTRGLSEEYLYRYKALY